MLLAGKKIGGDGTQQAFRAYRRWMNFTWRSYGSFRRARQGYKDRDGFASELPPSICSGSASGFCAAALLDQLDLVVVEPHEAVEVARRRFVC